MFPLFTDDDVSRVLLYYPSTNASVSISTPDFATMGNSTPTALNESTYATGQQQRADVSSLSPSRFFILFFRHTTNQCLPSLFIDIPLRPSHHQIALSFPSPFLASKAYHEIHHLRTSTQKQPSSAPPTGWPKPSPTTIASHTSINIPSSAPNTARTYPPTSAPPPRTNPPISTAPS